jgi:hypothetical protein
LSDLLSSISSDNGEAISTTSTPQNKAFNWMVTNNTHLETFSNEQIIQRYALATLYYSANGDSWDINESWLSESEECGIVWQTADSSLSCTGKKETQRLRPSSQASRSTEASADNPLRGKEVVIVLLLTVVLDKGTRIRIRSNKVRRVLRMHVHRKDTLFRVAPLPWVLPCVLIARRHVSLGQC